VRLEKHRAGERAMTNRLHHVFRFALSSSFAGDVTGGQRMPLALKSMILATFARVTKPGPVGMLPPGIRP